MSESIDQDFNPLKVRQMLKHFISQKYYQVKWISQL